MKKKTLPGLIRKLDSVFSKYVRMSAADVGGTVECVTCKKLLHWKDAHAGHFVSRRHMSVRWDTRNVHPQCCGCNTYQNGRLDDYSKYIVDTYGWPVFEGLLAAKHETKKWLRSEIEDLIARYSEYVKAFA